jgi:hypothetical protein
VYSRVCITLGRSPRSVPTLTGCPVSRPRAALDVYISHAFADVKSIFGRPAVIVFDGLQVGSQAILPKHA